MLLLQYGGALITLIIHEDAAHISIFVELLLNESLAWLACAGLVDYTLLRPFQVCYILGRRR